MTDDKIHPLLERTGPLPRNANLEQLKDFLDRSALQPDEKQSLFEWLTQPALRLIWAQPPQAGHDCVQTIEIRLPPALQGLHPRLHVCFPNTLQRLSGREATPHADRLLGTKTAADRAFWGLLDLQQYLAPESVWRTDMQFRLPKDLLGTYLWKFRIDFVDCWGHAELHRLFEARYTAVLARNEKGLTTLTIEAGDFTNVTLPDLRLWDNVIIRASGNANLLKAAEPVDYNAILKGTDQHAKPTQQGVIINLSVTRVTGNTTTVVTPHTPMRDASSSIRRSWPATLTADLRVTANSPAGSVRILRLHAADELRIGRVSKRTDKSGKVYTNDIVTDFTREDDPHLSPEQLDQRRTAISALNCELTISGDALTVRNTGSPWSESAGYTEVEYRVGKQTVTEALENRGDKCLIRGIREKQVAAVQLRVGGSPGAKGGPVHGYPLQLIPVLWWQDNDTNGWPKPEDYLELVGNLPKLCREASGHGMDAVLIKHQVQREQPVPLHVMLLRQLWLGMDGLPIEDLRLHRPREAATVRVLIASHELARERIFLVQPLQEERTLMVQSSTHKRPMRVEPRSLMPLHHGDRLMLMKKNGTPLWEAEFSVISSEDA
ncbi:MAG: hypothetical protein RLZZ436_2277 [Planctomycetota bacterium]|jgi:hypothetical protein